jgi:hypothetical protein
MSEKAWPSRPAVGILQSMTQLTTVKVSTDTRDELKSIAERDGLTLDGALRKLLKAERQRLMGLDLASRPMSDADRDWVRGSTAAVARALG